MKARTELLLYRLSWAADMMMRPTWRNLDSSFESWAYGNGLLRQIQRLEAQSYLETKRNPETGNRLVRLTEKGMDACRLGVDPEARWNREWDGKWRMVIFDVPEVDRRIRARMRRRLATEGFGWLQQSVWIAPSPFGIMLDELRGEVVDGNSLTLMEGTPAGGETPEDLVRGAWDFAAINQAWNALTAHLELAADPAIMREREHLPQWMARERELVRSCLRIDPLLPAMLLPADYLGRTVWTRRKEVIAKLSAGVHST